MSNISPHDEYGERPDVTVVIVSYNTAHLLDRLFATLEAARGSLRLQIIVIDNASRDDSVTVLRTRYPDIALIENSVNVGFGRANNQALPTARGRYVLLLNTDAFVSPDTLAKTVEYMDNNNQCGVLGVKLVGEDGALQPSCRYFPTPWNMFLSATGLFRMFPGTRLVDDMSWDHASLRECDWVPGCYYLVRAEVIERVGLFDPRYFLYYEEVDHCRTVRQAGWTVVYYPFTQVIHVGGESAGSETSLNADRQIPVLRIESELLYLRKHYGALGVLSATLLTALASVMTAFKELMRPRDAGRSRAQATYAWVMSKLLIKTRLATRPTR
jgi:N-acetylglucosaminyl-diphospho-decaprenol L-rhamnosyltransferase